MSYLRRGVMSVWRVGFGLRRLTSKALVYSEEVIRAKTTGSPIVALESTIITHGMPFPQNLETALAVEDIIREKGAVPATVAILKGQLSVGLSREQIEYLARAKGVVKASRRDLAPVVAAGLDGATTVAGTLVAAELADIPIFVTGGIGGVHREGENTLDVSADLTELGRSRVAVVCSGVKSILDVGKTLEYLETQGVCVCAFGDSDEFPAFYTRRSGHRAPHRASSPAHAARLLAAARALQLASSTVFAVPVPEDHAMDESIIDEAIAFALKEASRKGIHGKEVTPFILAAVSEVTGGRSLASNIALIKNNAKVGADIAVEFNKLKNVDNSASCFNIGFSRGTGNSGGSRGFHTSSRTCGRAPPPGGPAPGPVLVIGGANVDRTYRVTEDHIKYQPGAKPAARSRSVRVRGDRRARLHVNYRSRVSSSRSSATIKARRLSTEAQLARRSLEREQQLLELEQQLLEREQSIVQQQVQREQELARHRLNLNCERKLCEQKQRVEELEAEATLAAQEVDERSTRTVSQSYSRTASWVHDTNRTSTRRPAVGIKIDTIVPDPVQTDKGATMMVAGPEINMGPEPNYVTPQNVNDRGTQYFSRENIPRHDFNRNKLIQSHSVDVNRKAENHEIHGHIYKNPVSFQIPVNDNAKLFQTTTSKNALSYTRPSINSNENQCHSLSKQHEMNIYSHKCSHKLELTLFSGKTTEWLMFKRIYSETQHLFTPAENLVRLSGALRGQALESVSSLLYTAERPDEVLDMLEQTFALPEMIVLSEIALVRNLPKISFDQKELNQFACRLRNCIAVIRNLDQIEHIYSVELFHSVLSKLTPILYSQWKDFAFRSDRSKPKIQILSEFLDIEAIKHNRFGLIPDYTKRPGNSMPDLGRQPNNFMPELGRRPNNIMSQIGRRPGTVGNNLSHNWTRRENIHVTSARNTNGELCRYCNNKHKLTDCKDFISLTLDDKWTWLREAKICYKCLKSKTHRWKTCKIGRCGVDGCVRFHHPLLHSATSPHVPRASDEFPSTSYNVVTEHKDTNKTVTVSNVTESHTKDEMSTSHVFLKIVPVEVSGPYGKYDTFALLDCGSTATLIDSEVASRIGASGPMESIKVDGVAGMSTHKPIQQVNFCIKGKHCSDVFSVNNAKAMDSLSLFTQTIKPNDISKYPHLTDLIDVLTLCDAKPMILLGAEHWYLTVSREVREGTKNQPVATRTSLGWVLHGKSSSWTKPVHFINHVSVNDSVDSTMDELVKDYFRLDAIGISKPENMCCKEDKYALEVLESTAKRLPSGRFEVGLLWRKDTPNIPDSYPHALSRFLGLERRMTRDTEFKKDYCAFISNMMSKGYAEECSKYTYHDAIHTSDTHKPLRWYLPHFPVVHPQKRKLRVVHDAAARTSGVSLNSLLLPGPDLLQSLLHILFRFREGYIAMTADVKEMFPQIRIRAKDRDALRFIWREDPSCPLKEYRMTSVIFGAVCSPCTALYIKNRNAHELQKSYPAATKAIVHDHYMDDFLGSLDDIHEASQLAADIVTVHKAAGMEMRGWISNIPTALASVPEELRASTPGNVHVGPEAFVRTLGLIWHPNSDTFSFRNGSPIPEKEKVTKRKALSYLMCLYDPLGLLTPLVIQGRILFQQTWRTGIDWDTELQPDAIQKWLAWSRQLATIADVKIPRWYRCGFYNEDICDRQLHVFADASEEAYSCVAYWRFTFSNGTVKLSLIGGKARLSPLKPTSIPRLELQAGLIAARFANTVCTGHDIHPNSISFWSDSTTVLSWIRSDARTFKPFVANRVGEITEITNVKNWKFVPGVLNVADDATRLKDSDINLSRWFSGPDFLLLPFSEWPKEPSSPETAFILEELKPSKVHVGLTNLDKPSSVVPDPSRFSEWLRLIRATARVLQCVGKFRSFLAQNNPNSKRNNNISPPKLPPLSAMEMQKAEIAILRKAQTDSFGEELCLLRDSKSLPKSSKLNHLCPIINEDGLLSLDSRIKHIKNVDHATTSPIILDGRHIAVQLLIRHYHVQAAHAFNELVANELKQRFWIFRCRSEVRKASRRCAYCIKRKATPQIPPTGDLPDVRLEHHKRSFTNTGLDYFGPVQVSIGRRREKRWVALFTCMTTRAVHLEIVTSLSADSAIMSIRRFAARRGFPTKILSDNGTSFVGANRQLCEFYNDAVQDYAASKCIEWCYIPSAAPFMGGCWERLVKTVKTALLVTLKERAPKEELLHTLLLEAEALINSRPLTYVTENGECESLTPFHFLIGASSNQQLPARLDDGVFSMRKEWQKVLRLSEHFWTRWLREYLPSLKPRKSNRSKFENLKVNDVVLIVDPDLPRGVWPIGRILEVFPGRDGVVRVADVATKGGTLRRPARKLARLQDVVV